MRKIRFFIVIALTISIMLSNISFAYEPIKVYVDNARLNMEVEPIIQNGRTLVPLRAIFESLGADIRWDAETRTVTGTSAETTVTLQISSKTAYINGEPVELEVPAMIEAGRTMVPARFIAESLGATVGWDSLTKSVLINSDIESIRSYKVERIVDGDTIVVSKNGEEKTIRLIGIDTPELNFTGDGAADPFGIAALDYAKSMLIGKNVELEMDVQETDQYGRLLAYVWIDGIMLNKLLLEQGIAKVATYPPNVKYADEFMSIQQRAMEQKLGIWSNQPSQGELFIIEKTKSIIGPIGDPKTAQFIGSINSDKYHIPGYTHTGQINEENLIYFMSLEHAIMNGYKPCGYCF